MKWLPVIAILLSSTLSSRIYLDTHHGNYRGWYDEKKEQIVYVDTQTKKQVLVQPLKRDVFDRYEKVVTFTMIDFDGHIDAVVRSGLDEERIFLFRGERFMYDEVLTQRLLKCCTHYTRDKAKKQIIVTYTNTNSALLNYLTYKERLVYTFKQGKAVLIKREMTDHDICATYRITTSYGRKSSKPVEVRYSTAKEDVGNEIFFEARIEDNKTIRFCRNTYVKHRYAAIEYDNNGTVLTPYADIPKAVLYKETNHTVMETDSFKITAYQKGYILTTYTKEDNTWSEKNTTLNSTDIHGSLEEGFTKDEVYIQRVTNPEYLGKPMVNKKREQRIFYADEKGLMIVEDLLEGTFTIFRVNISGGGGIGSSIIFWGKDRDIIYLDEAEALVEYNLRTGQRRDIIYYESIGPWTSMHFTQKGDKALLTEISEEVTYFYYIDLHNLKHQRVAKIQYEVKVFRFDKTEQYLLYKDRNDKIRKVTLPKQ